MTVSIIIPVYNKERYLYNTLNTIVNQSFPDFECLLINDGSTDGSGEICDKFSNYDSRFRVFHIRNGGVSHARNIGLDQANGKYVTFIDGDDEIHVNYLYNLVNCAEMSGAEMVISGLTKRWENCDKTEQIIPAHLGTMTLDEIMPDFARVQRYTGIYGFVCSKLIKSEIIRDNRFNEKIKLAEDLDFFLSLYDHVNLLHFDSCAYYYYTQAAQNSSMLDSGWRIDYYAQLQIQKKVADLITRRGFMNGENAIITNQRLYDYVFFCMFYSPLQNLIPMCEAIRGLKLPRKQKYRESPVLKALLLFCFERKLDFLSVVLLSIYRTIRKILKRMRPAKFCQEGNSRTLNR